MTRHRWDHHPPCRCGCGELADECTGPRPNPLGSMRIVAAAPAPWGDCPTCPASPPTWRDIGEGLSRCDDCGTIRDAAEASR